VLKFSNSQNEFSREESRTKRFLFYISIYFWEEIISFLIPIISNAPYKLLDKCFINLNIYTYFLYIFRLNIWIHLYTFHIKLWPRMHNRAKMNRAFSRCSRPLFSSRLIYLHASYIYAKLTSTYDKLQTKARNRTEMHLVCIRVHIGTCVHYTCVYIFMQNARSHTHIHTWQTVNRTSYIDHAYILCVAHPHP